MVGGRIIELRPMTISMGTGRKPLEVTRIWCMDRDGSECCVYAERFVDGPGLGDEVWWQGRRIYYDGDKRWLKRVGYSFQPPTDSHLRA